MVKKFYSNLYKALEKQDEEEEEINISDEQNLRCSPGRNGNDTQRHEELQRQVATVV